jgi:hypothetical protein
MLKPASQAPETHGKAASRVGSASLSAHRTIASRTSTRPILGPFAAHVQREPTPRAHLRAAATSATLPATRLAPRPAVVRRRRVGDTDCFSVAKLGRINCDVFGRSALLDGRVCDGAQAVPDTEVSVGQIAMQTDGVGEYSVLVQSGAKLTLQAKSGTASAGPLAPASTNRVDIGCSGGSPDAGVDGATAEATCGPPSNACSKACP